MNFSVFVFMLFFAFGNCLLARRGVGTRQAQPSPTESLPEFNSRLLNQTSSNTTAVAVVLHRFFLGDVCDINSTTNFRDDHMWVVDECRTFYRYNALLGQRYPVGKKTTVNTTHVTFTLYMNTTGECIENEFSVITEEVSPMYNCSTQTDIDFLEDKEVAFNISEMYLMQTWALNTTQANNSSLERKSVYVEPAENNTCPAMNINATTFEGTALVEPLAQCIPLDSLEETTNGTTTRVMLEMMSTVDIPSYSWTEVCGDNILRAKYWDENCTELAFGNLEAVKVGQCSKIGPYLSADLMMEIIVPNETKYTMLETERQEEYDDDVGLEPSIVAVDQVEEWTV